MQSNLIKKNQIKTSKLKKAKDILRKDGLVPLAKKIFHVINMKFAIKVPVETGTYTNEKEIIEKTLNNDLTVRSGPFLGMHYTDTAFCSSLLPKIIGTYEAPIQKWIQEAIEKKYKKIVDIGSAEGYYSVGFAVTSKDSKIYAYDIDNEALTENKKMAKLNGVEEKIIFKNICDNRELNRIIEDGTLIVCDIEGAEKELLDPAKSPYLLKADLIVEAHDIFIEGITELLIKRFYKTHKIELIVDYPRNIADGLLYSQDKEIACSLLDEKRLDTRWLYMKKNIKTRR